MSAKAGEIFFCPEFPFKDGEIGKKYLVLLNSPANKDPYIFCRTTSQQKRKILKEDCQEDWLMFFLLSGKDVFPENTWLQFYELYAFTLEELLKLHTDNDLEYVAKLQDLTVRQIKNCIKECKEDIKKSYLKYIFSK